MKVFNIIYVWLYAFYYVAFYKKYIVLLYKILF